MVRTKGKFPAKKKIKELDDETDGTACVSGLSGVMNVASGEKNSALEAMIAKHDQISHEKFLIDSFYEKLIKLHDSSGLNLVFNLRESRLDLYVFYGEVTERGGFHQVSKEGKWNEVASALNLKSNLPSLPSQIQKVYENLLHQYEQIYYYRSPQKVSSVASPQDSAIVQCTGCSLRKRKSCDNTSQDDQVEKRKCEADTLRASAIGPHTPEQKLSMPTSLDDKEMIMDTYAPRKPKTSYQIFVKMECDRLKKIHEGSSGTLKFREMAVEAWKHLSQNDRLPYIEASRKDRERFNRETAIYKQHWNKKCAKSQNLPNSSTPSIISFGPSSPIDDDYYVTLEENTGNFFVPDESLVESAIKILKNARPNDPMFQINWDGCCGSPVSFS